jgi:hypothetical protein
VTGNIQAYEYRQVHIEGGEISFLPFKQAKTLTYRSGSATKAIDLQKVMLFRFKPADQDDTHSILAFPSESSPKWWRDSLAQTGVVQNWKTEGQFVMLVKATYADNTIQAPSMVLKVNLFD